MGEIRRADDPLDLTLSDDELEAHRENITGFISEQFEAARAEEAVICLSGGIDSTLTSHLTVEALGTGTVTGLVLPSRVNRDQNMSDAERVASELLDIEYEVIEIDPLVEAYLDANPRVDSSMALDDEDIELAVGNLRARIRSNLAYFVANRAGGFVVGTGNRSEAAVGYFTKYGDGAVDCHPIGNLYKQQVRQLAEYIGVPEAMAEKTASAELWDNQTDEEELGVSYDTLDSILALYIDGPLSKSATVRELGVDEAVVENVRVLYESSHHKRVAPPAPEPIE
jgi:NAD+ synthase